MQRSYKLFSQKYSLDFLDGCRPITGFARPLSALVVEYTGGLDCHKHFMDQFRDTEYNEAKDIKSRFEIVDLLEKKEFVDWNKKASECVRKGYIQSLMSIIDAEKIEPFAVVDVIYGDRVKRAHLPYEALEAKEWGIFWMLHDYTPVKNFSFREYAGAACGWNFDWGHSHQARSNILDLCVQTNNVSVATFLLECKADPDLAASNNTVISPILFAAFQRNPTLVTLFYQHSRKTFSKHKDKTRIEACLIPDPEHGRDLEKIRSEIKAYFEVYRATNKKSIVSKIQGLFKNEVKNDDNNQSEIERDQALFIEQKLLKAPNIQTISNIIENQIAVLEGRNDKPFEAPEIDLGFFGLLGPKVANTETRLYRVLCELQERLIQKYSKLLSPHAAASAGPGPGPAA